MCVGACIRVVPWVVGMLSSKGVECVVFVLWGGRCMSAVRFTARGERRCAFVHCVMERYAWVTSGVDSVKPAVASSVGSEYNMSSANHGQRSAGSIRVVRQQIG